MLNRIVIDAEQEGEPHHHRVVAVEGGVDIEIADPAGREDRSR